MSLHSHKVILCRKLVILKISKIQLQQFPKYTIFFLLTAHFTLRWLRELFSIKEVQFHPSIMFHFIIFCKSQYIYLLIFIIVMRGLHLHKTLTFAHPQHM